MHNIVFTFNVPAFTGYASAQKMCLGLISRWAPGDAGHAFISKVLSTLRSLTLPVPQSLVSPSCWTMRDLTLAAWEIACPTVQGSTERRVIASFQVRGGSSSELAAFILTLLRALIQG